MRFDLTREQELLREKARDLARREVEPLAAELDRSGRWPAEIVARLGQLGFLGVAVPAEHGGAGLDWVSTAVVVEEISAACASSGAIAITLNALFCGPLLRFGTPSQQREILAPAVAGQALGCFAFAEPPGGGVCAEKQGDGSFALDGSRILVTAARGAEHAIVFASDTALLVRRGTPGYTISAPDRRIGVRAAGACTLSFHGVRVPASQVLGGEGRGFEVALDTVDAGRIGVAAQAVGIARAAFDEAAAHAKEHVALLVGEQALQFMLSDMAMEIDAARLLTLRAARLRDGGARHTAESSMAKLFASEMATRVTHKAMQILGGEGIAAERGAERHYRDARITEIDEGPSEIQRTIIASSVLEG
jgi:butyryl-CoA dehydrogenase